MRTYRLPLLSAALGSALAVVACQRPGPEPTTAPERRGATAAKRELPHARGVPKGPPRGGREKRCIGAAAFSPDGRRIAAGDSYGIVTLYDERGGEVWAAQAKGVITALAFSADGSGIFTGGWAGTLTRWDTATAQVTWAREKAVGPASGVWDQPPDSISALAVSRDGKRVLVSGTHRFSLCDPASGEVLRTWWSNKRNAGQGLALSPDGRLALSAHLPEGRAVGATLWDLATGKALHYLEPPQDAALRAVVFSPDGKQAVAGCWYGHVGFWDVGSGKLLRTLRPHAQEVYALALSPDGRLGLSSEAVRGGDSGDGSVLLWEVASGKVLRPLAGWRGEATTVAFSADGKRALAGGVLPGTSPRMYDNRALLVWDVARGTLAAAPAAPWLEED